MAPLAEASDVSMELAALAQQVADIIKDLVRTFLRRAVCDHWRHRVSIWTVDVDSNSQVGQVSFTTAYNAVRERIVAVRQHRKRKRATEKVLDPQVCSQRIYSCNYSPPLMLCTSNAMRHPSRLQSGKCERTCARKMLGSAKWIHTDLIGWDLVSKYATKYSDSAYIYDECKQ